MDKISKYINDIFSISSEEDFSRCALLVFQYQYTFNPVYKEYVDFLKIDPHTVDSVHKIPFLPIALFKSHQVIVGNTVEKIFLSSGTTQKNRSKHYVKDLNVYEKSFLNTFELFFGSIKDLTVLCLLPSYQEQGDSSLVYMTDCLVKKSQKPLSGYFLNENERLNEVILNLERNKENYVLFGVSYALLDYIEEYKYSLNYGVIIETGGMKGRRKELIKEELHKRLKSGFGTSSISSEYGMTELLSQAYSKENQVFSCPPWMRVTLRATDDPFASASKNGLINVIDLANVYSCSFIATDDVGELIGKDTFKVLGRYDHADIRGCNLLVQ